ncbi:MAG TPA: TetR/AcrR family transcriptional regulator [Candidatus Nitrosotenuis sp.]|jgi:AcrR family transcriptional regulator|nr:TetR/AcrR family transcriptional regulator [Candidatus Nitrosotenuis sp.]
MTQRDEQRDQTRREKILNSALEIFIERGFAGTSMSMIAKKAEVPQSLIYHYFENKERVWREVKAALMAYYDNEEDLENWDELSFKTFIEKLVSRRVRFYLKNPLVMRMINWQRLEADPVLEGQTPLTVTWLTPYLKYYQEKGQMRRDLDPMQIATWVITSITAPLFDYYAMYQNNLSLQENYIQMVSSCLFRALCC